MQLTTDLLNIMFLGGIVAFLQRKFYRKPKILKIRYISIFANNIVFNFVLMKDDIYQYLI